MASSVTKFIYRTAMATALLGLAGVSCAYAGPTVSITPSRINAQTGASVAGPGWAAVDQLLGTFDSAGSSKLSKSAAKAASNPSSLIDYQEMSVRCLGKKDWESLTAGQRSQFVASLKGLVEQRYYPRWHKIFGKGKVTFQEEASQSGDILVKTKLLLGKKEELLSWRVANQSGSQKVISLSVANSDLLERLKSRIKARQKKAGFDALLAWMKGRSSEDMGVSAGGAVASASNSRTSAGNGVGNSVGGSTSGAVTGIVLPIAAVRPPSLSGGAAASITD